MTDAERAKEAAEQCLAEAESLRNLWDTRMPWAFIRRVAEHLFPFILEAEDAIAAVEDRLPEGCPVVLPLAVVPSGRGGLFVPTEKVTAHRQALRILTSLVSHVDKGGLISQSPENVFDRNKPWPVELPARFGELREWVGKEYDAISGKDS